MRYHYKKPGSWTWSVYTTDSLAADLAAGKIGSDWRLRVEGDSQDYTPEELIEAQTASRVRAAEEARLVRARSAESALSTEPHYGGFWRRFAAFWLDFLIFVPLLVLVFWGSERYRLFSVYYLVPGIVLGLFYSVYLVRRYGGTPGKLLMRLRIRKVSGEPVGYREALLRFAPEFLFGMLVSFAFILSALQMTDAQYHALSYVERSKSLAELAPGWLKPVQILQQVWVWGEFIVLLTNRKRRALHDFIAGTVVIRKEA